MQPQTGSFLMAHPLLDDENFTRTVVLLTHRDEHSCVGLIVNKLSEYTLDQALIGDWPDWPLYLGGPVGTDSLYFVHRRPDLIPDSDEVLPGLYFGGNFDSFKQAIRTQQLGRDDVRCFAGYSGWAEGQLETELSEPSWLIQQAPVLADWWTEPELYRSWAKSWPDELKLWLNVPEVPYWN